MWEDEKPIRAWLLNTSVRAMIHERMAIIMDGLEVIHRNYASKASALVCEKAQGYEDQRPAPELQALIREIGIWARGKKMGFALIHPQTIVAAVRPRGTKGMDNKAVIKLGVTMLYGDCLNLDLHISQDVYDAVAIGHAYLCQLKESEYQ